MTSQTAAISSAIGAVELKLSGYRCRCGHEWLARNKAERPRVCPNCKSPNWDRPLIRKRSNGSRTSPEVD
jgi:predicted Zn-ribbon and HTH transcriptional regulator